MSASPLKVVGFLTIAAVIGFICFLFVGFKFFSYKAITIVTGCEQEFCVDRNKTQVAAIFDGKYSFERGVMVPYDPTIQPSKYTSSNHANTIEELIEMDRWTVVYDKDKGWRKFVHLKFKDDVLYKIDTVNYGPFYIAP